MFKPMLLTAAALTAAAATASAATTSETVKFDYNPFEGTTELVLNGFDTQGGTRVLTKATFEFHHNFDISIYLESTGPTAVNQGDYGLNIGFISILQLGTIEGGDSPPFFGPGGFFIADYNTALGAYDGVPGNDGPDSSLGSYQEAYNTLFAFNHSEQSVLDALTDSGPLTTVYGGFTELFFYWNNDPGWPAPGGFFPDYPTDAAIWVSFADSRHFGDFTIKYKYANVPGPMAAGPVALLAFAFRRRRG